MPCKAPLACLAIRGHHCLLTWVSHEFLGFLRFCVEAKRQQDRVEGSERPKGLAKNSATPQVEKQSLLVVLGHCAWDRIRTASRMHVMPRSKFEHQSELNQTALWPSAP